MRTKTIILASILGAAIFLSVLTMNVMAQKGAGAFVSSKSDRSLIKDILVGQKEIKATLRQLNKKIDDGGICK